MHRMQGRRGDAALSVQFVAAANVDDSLETGFKERRKRVTGVGGWTVVKNVFVGQTWCEVRSQKKIQTTMSTLKGDLNPRKSARRCDAQAFTQHTHSHSGRWPRSFPNQLGRFIFPPSLYPWNRLRLATRAQGTNAHLHPHLLFNYFPSNNLCNCSGEYRFLFPPCSTSGNRIAATFLPSSLSMLKVLAASCVLITSN